MAILNFQLVVSGDLAAAQDATRSALEAADFTVTDKGDHWKAAHGSIARTMFQGFITSEDSLREVLDVKFTDLGGTVQVDLHRPIFQPGSGNDDGLVQVRLYNAYKEAVGKVAADLEGRGILVSSKI
ncbi:hypothetical protein [Microbacterium testaceum]|uniref:Uncharacterized protein n=1 Tax=Microbacterium testaceum TaxID=2033 RepID=A0A147FB81_MICTE|nr:hypothetical protein [Microbacterium testaceum]KTS13755.1 hypothetical protein RSA3_03080 [Microbacterium testaceum]